jgi:hypothetical protein
MSKDEGRGGAVNAKSLNTPVQSTDDWLIHALGPLSQKETPTAALGNRARQPAVFLCDASSPIWISCSDRGIITIRRSRPPTPSRAALKTSMKPRSNKTQQDHPAGRLDCCSPVVELLSLIES